MTFLLELCMGHEWCVRNRFHFNNSTIFIFYKERPAFTDNQMLDLLQSAYQRIRVSNAYILQTTNASTRHAAIFVYLATTHVDTHACVHLL